MRRSKILCLTFVPILLLASTISPAQTITVSTFENSGIEQIYLPILKEAYSELGIELHIKRYPPQRALQAANSGTVDAEAARLQAIEKTNGNLVRVNIPLGAIQTRVFSHTLTPSLKDWNSLRGYKIITLLGYKRAAKMSSGMNRIQAHNPKQALSLLQKRKADFAVLPLLDGVNALNRNSITGIKVLSPPIDENQLYHYLHRKHAVLTPKLEAVLAKMQAQGRLAYYRTKALENVLSRNDDAKLTSPL